MHLSISHAFSSSKVLNRRRGVKKCEADLIFDLSLLPTRRRRAGNRLDEMVRAHLKEAAIAPERRTLRTVLRDIFRSRAISLIDLPFCKCSRLIRPIVSTTTIPHRPLDARAGRPASSLQGGGQICTPKHSQGAASPSAASLHHCADMAAQTRAALSMARARDRPI